MGIPVLAAVWGGATASVVVKAANIHRLVSVSKALYITLGWAVIVALPVLVVSVPASGLALMVSGGIAYAVGAIVFLLGRPDPRPNVFGFHQVWHACTTAGPSATSPWCGSSSRRRRTHFPGDRRWPRPRGDNRVSDCASSGAAIDLGSDRQWARHDRRRDDGVQTRRFPDEGRMRRRTRIRQHPSERCDRTVGSPGCSSVLGAYVRFDEDVEYLADGALLGDRFA